MQTSSSSSDDIQLTISSGKALQLESKGKDEQRGFGDMIKGALEASFKRRGPELDLDTLEIIEVGNSEEEEKWNQTVFAGMRQLDGLPEEILIGICYYLTEKDMVHLAAANKRFDAMMNEGHVWADKVRSWTNILVDENPHNPRLKGFYVDNYLQNKGIQDQKIIAATTRRRYLQTQHTTKLILKYSNKIFFDMRWMDTFLLFLIFCWSVLLPIRADQFILWNWHAIYSPLYFAFFWSFLGLIALCICAALLESIRRNPHNPAHHSPNALPPDLNVKVRNTMTLMLKMFNPWTAITSFLIWIMLLVFVVLVADYQNDESGIMETPAVTIAPIAIIFPIVFFAAPVAWALKYTEAVAACCCLSCPLIIWAFIPVYLKAFYWTVPDFSWADAFHVFWGLFVIICCCGVLYTVVILGLWIGNLVHHHSVEGQLAEFGLVAFWSFHILCVWFIFLTLNLDWQDNNLPMWPWILTFIPCWLAQGGFMYCVVWIDWFIKVHAT